MLKRHIEEELKAFLRIMPVVLITGGRQTGKTTLAKWVASENKYNYFTFDDENTLYSALRDPTGWVESLPKPVIIDEVQRVPEIFLSIKKDVDSKRVPGQYLLTGSANPLLLPRLGDSLAGRMGIVNLFPFSQGELLKRPESFIQLIFGEQLEMKKIPKLDKDLYYEILLKGGYPTVQNFKDIKDIKRWVRSYLQTIIQRDVKDISNIEAVREFPKLFRFLATRISSLLNISDISRMLGMVNVTLTRYLRLLETLYFIYLLPPWFSNLGKRFSKMPKLHMYDTAILTSLLDIDQSRLEADPALTGQLLETFIFSELIKLKSWSDIPFQIFHFRDRQYEVDFVLENADGSIVGIEVKSSRTVKKEDLKGLFHLKDKAKNHFKRGIILHRGDQIEPLGNEIFSVPIQTIWN